MSYRHGTTPLSVIITLKQPRYASDRQAANRPKLCLSLPKIAHNPMLSALTGAQIAQTLPVASTRITSMTTLFGKIQCCGTMRGKKVTGFASEQVFYSLEAGNEQSGNRKSLDCARCGIGRKDVS